MKASREQGQNTRQRLLVAAVSVFAQKGYEAAGIREIARAAQVNSAMVQYHFGGKDGLYRAALDFLFDQGPSNLVDVPEPPSPEDPEARAKAAVLLQRYIRSLLEAVFACPEDQDFPPEFEAAAHLSWTRALLEPEGHSDLILAHIRPYTEKLWAALEVLFPERSQEERFRLGASIQAQVLFFHHHARIIALLRGAPYGPADVPDLAAHITSFSLRGLGLAAFLPNEGA